NENPNNLSFLKWLQFGEYVASFRRFLKSLLVQCRKFRSRDYGVVSFRIQQADLACYRFCSSSTVSRQNLDSDTQLLQFLNGMCGIVLWRIKECEESLKRQVLFVVRIHLVCLLGKNWASCDRNGPHTLFVQGS